MDRRSLIELTNLCLIYDGDKILVEEKIWKNQKGIVFPGGHVEPGESLLNAVIREMREETGLIIENPIPCGYKDWINEDGSRYVVLMYKTNRFRGTLRSSEEGRVFWVTRDEFEQMDNVMWDMKPLLKILESDEYSELFYEQGAEDWKLLG